MRPGWESCAANWQGSVACRERISLEGSLSSRCSNCNYVYCVFFGGLDLCADILGYRDFIPSCVFVAAAGIGWVSRWA